MLNFNLNIKIIIGAHWKPELSSFPNTFRWKYIPTNQSHCIVVNLNLNITGFAIAFVTASVPTSSHTSATRSSNFLLVVA
jgi:hypothetical protein